MRVLAFADEPPPAEPAELVERNRPDLVVTLGDLRPAWMGSLRDAGVPCLGVPGNHDAPGDLEAMGVTDLHLARTVVAGWRIAGIGGAIREGGGPRGPYELTQEQAGALVRELPAADLLICHCPPWGVDDEPDDPAHVGIRALRDWVARHRPAALAHGHTNPDPRTRTSDLDGTRVVWVRGARMLRL